LKAADRSKGFERDGHEATTVGTARVYAFDCKTERLCAVFCNLPKEGASRVNGEATWS
jgi:hypothetical protein